MLVNLGAFPEKSAGLWGGTISREKDIGSVS